MKAALKFNACWAFLMTVLIGIWTMGTLPRMYVFLICSIYWLVSVHACKPKRWAVAVVLMFTTLCMLLWLPMVSMNFYMFYTGANIYQDSPATILIVAIEAFLFAVPSSILFLWFVCRYKALIVIIAGEEQAKVFKDSRLAAFLVFAFVLSVSCALVFHYYLQYLHAVEVDAQWLVLRRAEQYE